ncbi:MAG: hypothetical protein ACHQRM_08125 [Bacteroidia bacterium]
MSGQTKNRGRIIGHLTISMCLFLFLASGCRNSFLKTTPVPVLLLSASEELRYMIHTDQKDRRQTLIRATFFPKNKKVATWMLRDESRLKRTRELMAADSLHSDEDTFNAGILLLHDGPNRRLEDTIPYYYAARLFTTLSLFGKTPMMKTNGSIYKKIAEGHSEELKKKYLSNSATVTTPIQIHSR